ncbi:hypothetical protein CASFOL_013422 [Castilleja foliolosa]|uniref:Reverse transcriptase domain-containing protein n=1 Tax=Castilleja foliolosa TaxID=1961234 RepID=A0ABD3DLS5_9LAMI
MRVKITHINECISTTSLSFLLNGSPFGCVKPTRGIRQGDPLSPFLFVLYMEVLSRLLMKEEALGHFKGIKIARTAPSINHLLFADDLVIYCRARPDDALCIKSILSKFTLWSSQKPNFDKSIIHFSKNTEVHTKNEILNILNFSDCNHTSLHLGIHFCKPNSRKDASSATLNKITSTLKGWKSRILSQASRSVLIQAVAQAIPTYTMSTTLIPLGTCHKMDSAIKRFWWGQNEKGNCLFLKCWDTLCAPKSIGGLGFKRMEDLNKSLFSKLVWTLCTNNNKAWVHLFKAKYLRGLSFLSDKTDHNNSSWIWKDLNSCKSLISSGAIFPIHLNSNVLIWKDPWIPTIQGFVPRSDTIVSNPSLVNFVRDLFDSRSCSWKIETLTTIFSPDVVHEISKLHISPEDRQKTLIWSPSKSGKFSSKSVYLHSQDARFKSANSSISFNWKLLWKAKIHNRLKLLLWKILHNAIPCKARLNVLFNTNDTKCYFCNHNLESSDHIFLLCPFINQAWFTSYWNFNASNFSNFTIVQWLAFIFDEKNNLFTSPALRAEFILFTAILFDDIWYSRNLIAHGSPGFPVQVLVANVSRKTKAHWTSLIQTSISTAAVHLVWKCPPADWVKINVDAAFSNGRAKSGVVLRNSNGSFMAAAIYSHSCLDALAAECLGLLDACNLLISLKIDKAIVESDSLIAITMLSSKPQNSYWTASPIVEKIFKVWHCWPNWSFKFIPRNANNAAHNLAKWSFVCNLEGLIPLDSLPTSVFCDSGFPLVDPL